MIRSLNYLVLILLLPFITSCNPSIREEISDIVNQVEDKYVPDKRVALFDIAVVEEEGIVTVKGETNLIAAFNELDSLIKSNYRKANNIVELLPSPSLDGKYRGIINLSVANFRSRPSHYADLVTQALLGTPVIILKKQNSWYLVQTPDLYIGWTNESSIRLFTNDEMSEYNQSKRMIFIDLSGSCYSLPDDNSMPVSDMVLGSILEVVDDNSGFFKVKFPDMRSGYIRKDQGNLLAEWKNSFTYSQEKITETARKFLGMPYLWGGTSSKAVDCSGFVKTVFFINGIILPRDASQQALIGDQIVLSEDFKELEPADLLFFGVHKTDSTNERITHVGIFIGNDEMIHSSGLVRINSLLPEKENYSEHLDRIFIRAQRILTSVGKTGVEPLFSNAFYK